MRITVERRLAEADVPRFYEAYRSAFAPLERLAAARHLLSADEFAEEMKDERIQKWVAWNGSDAIGLTTLTTDLSAIPWISKKFFASRYPQHAERGTLFYLGYTLVDRRAGRTHGVFAKMIDAIGQHVVGVKGVCAADYARFNAYRSVGKIISKTPELWHSKVKEVDVQTYVVVETPGSDLPDGTGDSTT